MGFTFDYVVNVKRSKSLYIYFYYTFHYLPHDHSKKQNSHTCKSLCILRVIELKQNSHTNVTKPYDKLLR